MQKFLDEPHYYPMSADLNIPLDYIQDFIKNVDDKYWVNHSSTQSVRDTEIWWMGLTRIEKYETLPDDHHVHLMYKRHPDWDPEKVPNFINLPYSMLLLKIHANDHMKPHTDGMVNPRRTVWSFPLSGEYAPVRFYDNFDEECVDEYTGQMLLNTANIHEVENGNEVRYNLQITFEYPIDEVLEAHKEYFNG